MRIKRFLKKVNNIKKKGIFAQNYDFMPKNTILSSKIGRLLELSSLKSTNSASQSANVM
jgi:hypothetical protein